jgi:pimeloyl-ACP methyl ester carboxylesterase
MTVYLVLAVLVIAAIVYFAGPRTRVDTTIRFNPGAIGDDIDAYLQREEARFPDIRDGLQKRVVWAYPRSKAKTPVSVVYLHGFSASSMEISPVLDMVSASLGANLYYARLSGHGRSGEAMADATVNAWLNDAAEAVAIGQRIGEKVIVVGTSTGATLATVFVTEEKAPTDLAGIVQISPNYGPRAAGSSLLAGPWAKQILQLVEGDERGFEPHTELHRKYWTYHYPSVALLPMAALVKQAESEDVGKIEIPSLFIFSDQDQVVDPQRTRAIVSRWGGETEIVTVTGSGDPDNHVNAGDALSPQTTDWMAQTITDWIRKTAGISD